MSVQRKLEDMIGEPGGMSTPVPSPDKSKATSDNTSGGEPRQIHIQDPRIVKQISRFDVKKVSEDREAAPTDAPAHAHETHTMIAENECADAQGLRKDKNRSRSMSIEAWRVAAEEEHYDSSPSPVSCYDTASESGPYGNEILPGI